MAVPALLSAQAAVEAAAGMSRAATTAVPARKIEKGIAGALDTLSRGIENAGDPKIATGNSKAPATPAKPSASVKPKSPGTKPPVQAPKAETSPEVVYEDPSGIREGMSSAEISRRFGPPSLSLTTGPGQETLCYAGKGTNVDVTVVDGKVTALQKTGTADKAGAVTIR